jgi:hypothetical protein
MSFANCRLARKTEGIFQRTNFGIHGFTGTVSKLPVALTLLVKSSAQTTHQIMKTKIAAMTILCGLSLRAIAQTGGAGSGAGNNSHGYVSPGGPNPPGYATPGGPNPPGYATPGGTNAPGFATPGGNNSPRFVSPGGNNPPPGNSSNTNN